MKTFVILFCILVGLMICSCTSGRSWQPEQNKVQNVLVEHYQQGNVHYIIFERVGGGGIDCKNYTEDSTNEAMNKVYGYNIYDSITVPPDIDTSFIVEHSKILKK